MTELFIMSFNKEIEKIAGKGSGFLSKLFKHKPKPQPITTEVTMENVDKVKETLDKIYKKYRRDGQTNWKNILLTGAGVGVTGSIANKVLNRRYSSQPQPQQIPMPLSNHYYNNYGGQ